MTKRKKIKTIGWARIGYKKKSLWEGFGFLIYKTKKEAYIFRGSDKIIKVKIEEI